MDKSMWSGRGGTVRLAWAVLVVVVAGCFAPPDDRLQREAAGGESNDSFETAMAVRYDQAGVARLAGTITRGDIDVYDLGPLQRGDRIAIDVRVTFGDLIPTVAVFDAETRLVVTNPVESVGQRSFAFEEIIRHDSAPYYLGIAEEYGTNTAGAYELTIAVGRGGSAPQAEPQTIVLDFEGGEVDVPNVGTFEFEPLSAERLGFEAEQSGQLRELIEATVEENFAGYGVVAVSTDETLPHGAYSIIHFGGFDPKLFGISENIDYYNRDKTDEAIVFAESFVGVFGLEPTLEQMATALGNIAAHEGGHLLGLNHTADAASLMDSASPPDSFIGDQEFIWTDLAEQIFPIGTQDAPLLLSETVGPGQ